MKQLALITLLLIITLGESAFILHQNETNIEYPIVISYRQFKEDWQLMSTEIFSGVVTNGSRTAPWGDIIYWKVGDIYFLDVDSVAFLHAGGHEVALLLQEEGARGFIIGDDARKPGRVFVVPKKTDGLTVPVASVGRLDWIDLKEILARGEEISFEVSMDESTWFSFMPGLLVLTVIMILLSFIPASMSIRKLILFARYSSHSTLAIVCLSFNVFGDSIRVLTYMLDAYFFYPLNIYVLSFVSAATISQFLLGNALLLICYWGEMLKPTSFQINSFLSWLFWPFIAIDALLLLYMGIAEVLLAFRVDYLSYAIIITAFCNFVLGILYFIISYQVLKSIKTQISRITKKRKLTTMTLRIILAGVMMITSVPVDIIFGVYDIIHVWDYPGVNIFLLTLRYIQWMIISIVFTSIFEINTRSSSSSKKASIQRDKTSTKTAKKPSRSVKTSEKVPLSTIQTSSSTPESTTSQSSSPPPESSQSSSHTQQSSSQSSSSPTQQSSSPSSQSSSSD